MWVVSFTPQGKSAWYPLDRRLGGPQSRSDAVVKRQIPSPLPGLELPNIQPVTQRYAIGLSWLRKIPVGCDIIHHMRWMVMLPGLANKWTWRPLRCTKWQRTYTESWATPTYIHFTLSSYKISKLKFLTLSSGQVPIWRRIRIRKSKLWRSTGHITLLMGNGALAEWLTGHGRIVRIKRHLPLYHLATTSIMPWDWTRTGMCHLEQVINLDCDL
jgi:hypothetical protein